MSLTVDDDARVTAIRGTDFLRLGEYAADDQSGQRLLLTHLRTGSLGRPGP
jgi:hypothetical protein